VVVLLLLLVLVWRWCLSSSYADDYIRVATTYESGVWPVQTPCFANVSSRGSPTTPASTLAIMFSMSIHLEVCEAASMMVVTSTMVVRSMMVVTSTMMVRSMMVVTSTMMVRSMMVVTSTMAVRSMMVVRIMVVIESNDSLSEEGAVSGETSDTRE
jgi:hypothetical protein